MEEMDSREIFLRLKCAVIAPTASQRHEEHSKMLVSPNNPVISLYDFVTVMFGAVYRKQMWPSFRGLVCSTVFPDVRKTFIPSLQLLPPSAPPLPPSAPPLLLPRIISHR